MDDSETAPKGRLTYAHVRAGFSACLWPWPASEGEMTGTMFLAGVGLGLALIDFTGLTQWVEGKIRRLMISAWRAGVEHLQFGLFLIVGGLLLTLALWFFGAFSLERPRFDAREMLVSLVGFALVPTLCFAVYGIIWILSLPKRGVVSTFGLLLAAVALVLELT